MGLRMDIRRIWLSMRLRKLFDHYLRNRSPVFVCFLDARKAFDQVNHWTLFEKLIRQGVDLGIVRLLVSWSFHVLWGPCLSDRFKVTNGVRQSGILSH